MEAIRKRMMEMVAEREKFVAENEALKAERDALAKLLKEYGEHHWTCQSTYGTGLPCDCVYGAALEKYATRKE